ncbi:transferase family protein [Penicillium atrosanguineum]|nr:transferase family protein [Penicillium atrosanguineum]
MKYELSDMDKMGMRKIVKLFIVYELQSAVDLDILIASITAGVRNATKRLPIMTGDLEVDSSGKAYIVAAPGSQVEVNIRRFKPTEHKPLSVLAASGFHPSDMDPVQLLPEEPTAKNPVCSLQLSVIEGGLILGFRMNHAAGDWSSIDTFLSLVCQGSKAHQQGMEMPTHTPDFNRAPYNASASESALSRAELLEKLQIFYIMELSQFKPKPPPISKSGIYRISEPTIQQLKAQCAPFVSPVDYITSYSCISALVWTAVTRARLYLHPEKATSPSRFIHPINVRTRDPEKETSELYFGNAVIAGQAGPRTARDAAFGGDEGIARAAVLIRESINTINMSSIAHMTSLIKSLSPGEIPASRADFADMDMMMNSWYSGTAEKYDVGAGAVPVAVRLPSTMAGVSMILPNFSRGATRVFEVLVELAVKEHDLLRQDAEFLKYFEIVA